MFAVRSDADCGGAGQTILVHGRCGAGGIAMAKVTRSAQHVHDTVDMQGSVGDVAGGIDVGVALEARGIGRMRWWWWNAVAVPTLGLGVVDCGPSRLGELAAPRGLAVAERHTGGFAAVPCWSDSTCGCDAAEDDFRGQFGIDVAWIAELHWYDVAIAAIDWTAYLAPRKMRLVGSDA